MVDVIVVTYNHAKYIEECLNSILNQKTNFPVRIIIGEDESSDGNREICQRFQKQYPNRIKLLLGKRSEAMTIKGRPTGRRNFLNCLAEVKAKYTALCDGDDYWSDDTKLQQQIDFLETNDDFSISFHKTQEYWENTKEWKEVNLNEPKVSDFEYLVKNSWYIRTASMVYRNSCFKIPHWFNDVQSADYAMQLILTEDGSKIHYINQSMAVYRRLSTGISQTKMHDDYLRYLDYNLDQLRIFREGFKNHSHLFTENIDRLEEDYFQHLLIKKGKSVKDYGRLLSLIIHLKKYQKVNSFLKNKLHPN